MKNITQNDKNAQNEQNTQDIKHEASAIKDDMKNVLERLGKIKGAGADMLSAEMDSWMSSMSDMKDKAFEQGKEGMESLAWCIQKNPIRSLMYGFGAGMILALLFKK